MPRVIFPLVALLAALAVAACGGGAAASSAAASQPAASQPVASEPAGSSAAVCTEAPTPADATVTVTIKDFSYAPEPVVAGVGDVIAWTNDDSPQHTATLEDDSCGTATLSTGSTGALVFSQAGTYTYKCEVHLGQMKGFTIEIQ